MVPAFPMLWQARARRDAMMISVGFAFLVAGAVTSLPAAIAVFALVKRPMFLWYIGLALTGALLSGLLYQVFSG